MTFELDPDPDPEAVPDVDPELEPEVPPGPALDGVLLPFDEPQATTPNMAETIAVATTARDFLDLILSPFNASLWTRGANAAR
jgi:hypothetical protein